jgi:hypothetical protein
MYAIFILAQCAHLCFCAFSNAHQKAIKAALCAQLGIEAVPCMSLLA